MQKNYESLQVTFTFEIYFDQLDKGMRIQSQTLWQLLLPPLTFLAVSQSP